MAKAKTKDTPTPAVCPKCFPGGAPADAVSVGCEHGTWVVDPSAPPPPQPVTGDEKAAYEQRITDLEAQLAEAKAAQTASNPTQVESPPAQ